MIDSLLLTELKAHFRSIFMMEFSIKFTVFHNKQTSSNRRVEMIFQSFFIMKLIVRPRDNSTTTILSYQWQETRDILKYQCAIMLNTKEFSWLVRLRSHKTFRRFKAENMKNNFSLWKMFSNSDFTFPPYLFFLNHHPNT